MEVGEQSYLVTDPTTVLRRGLLSLRLKHFRWKRLEKLIELDNQLIGLHFSANGYRCGLVKAGKARQKAPPIGEPPLSPPPLSPPPPKPPPKPPPQQPSVWRLRLLIVELHVTPASLFCEY